MTLMPMAVCLCFVLCMLNGCLYATYAIEQALSDSNKIDTPRTTMAHLINLRQEAVGVDAVSGALQHEHLSRSPLS